MKCQLDGSRGDQKGSAGTHDGAGDRSRVRLVPRSAIFELIWIRVGVAIEDRAIGEESTADREPDHTGTQ